MNKALLHECYFYGLYMDPDILKELGVSPQSVRNAVLKEFKLDLKGLAKVIPNKDSEVWGTLIKLKNNEITSLYSGEVTGQYKPQEVMVTTQNGENILAICYNVPENLNAEINTDYLIKLVNATRKLLLPEEYITTLEELKTTYPHNAHQ